MALVRVLDKIADWLKAEICKGWKLKPNDPSNEEDEDWEYQLSEPEVFVMYVPISGTLPPHIKATVPAICIELADPSTDHLLEQRREINLRLSFSAWDPGTHGPDMLYPRTEGQPWDYYQGDPGTLTKTSDGWRDVWNFIDRAARIIENNEALAGYPLDRDKGLKFGVYNYQDSPANYYPFWFGWIQLTVNELIVRNRSFEDLL